MKNILTILSALEELTKIGYRIYPKDYLNGFADVCKLTGLMGRWQKVHSYPDIICDTGHNVDGIKYVCGHLDFLHQKFNQELHIVFGMVNDKDTAVSCKSTERCTLLFYQSKRETCTSGK